MYSLKTCFVGIGSIARRHISNLKSVCNEREISLTVDALRRDKNSNIVSGINNTYDDLKEMPDDYDAVFITNPTEFHLSSLISLHDKGKNFFIEKPFVSLKQLESAKIFKTRDNTVYYVACPLRYNAVINYIKENINNKDVLSVRSISSSYLPEWRAGQDYRLSYSAHRDLGGGVSIDLIHEWDYLVYLFGKPQNIKCLIGKKSDLEINSDDYAVYIAEYADKIVELHLDYFGRKTIREVQLITANDTIIGDILNNKVRFLISGDEFSFNEERDDYQKRELNHFLDMVLGFSPKENLLKHSIRVLEYSQGIIDG